MAKKITKKVAAKKPVAKKVAAKKPVAKKVEAKKPIAKKIEAKKSAAKKVEAKKPAVLPAKSKVLSREEAIQKYTKQYQELVKELNKNKNSQSQEIQNLYDLILGLTTIILSISKYNKIDTSIDSLKSALDLYYEKKRNLEEIKGQLQQIQKQTGISAITEKALAIANQTIEQLEKQIAELTNKHPNLEKPDIKNKVVENTETQNNSNTKIAELASRIAKLQSGTQPKNSGENSGEKSQVKEENKKTQTGGSKDFCSTLLTLLMVEANKEEEFDFEEFMKKANITLEELGQCPLVLKALAYLVDQAIPQKMADDSYTFFSLGENENQEFTKSLEKAYNSNFNEKERKILKKIAPPFVLHANSPEEFQDVLGKNSYFLNGVIGEDEKDVSLYGLDYDDLVVTPEERKAIEKGGVPAGGLLVLYLVAAGLNQNSSK